MMGVCNENEIFEASNLMNAAGTFDVSLEPQDDVDIPAGRMVIDKVYSGDLSGTGRGQMISKRTEGGSAVYFAIEEFSGSANGKKGAFTLIHKGYMNQESQMLDVDILGGSGSGELESISGKMSITQDSGGHSYQLEYEI